MTDFGFIKRIKKVSKQVALTLFISFLSFKEPAQACYQYVQ